MSAKPKVIVLRTAGTNCDQETAFAFESFGADVDLVHINELYSKVKCLGDYHILVLPGGFTYGDDIESGRILANELRLHFAEEIRTFISDQKLILGICNGFQVLVKAGILPGPSNGEEISEYHFSQSVSLTFNDSGKFEDRWIHLKLNSRSVWTEGMENNIYLPVAHAEGKFLTGSVSQTKQLKEHKQIAFQYVNKDDSEPDYPANPNGSVEHIAGITDQTGRILGLMPHPERHFLFQHHPFWTRLGKKRKYGDGAKIFGNGVKYVKNNLLGAGITSTRVAIGQP